MSTQQQNDTDLIEVFKENIQTLGILIQKVEDQFQNNYDPVIRVKLKELKSELLIEDVKLQESKIEKITKTLDTLCSPIESPKG